jgi:cytochrome c
LLRSRIQTISFRSIFEILGSAKRDWRFMNMELNKIAGSVLGTALAVYGLGALGAAVYHTEAPEKPGMLIATAEAEETGGGTAAEAQPLPVLLASASAEKGATVAKTCAACHDFSKGGPNKVGPNMWDIVERPRGSHEAFAYSDGMMSKKGDPWTYENLNAFLKAPKEYVAGTKMAFGGIKSDAKRADLLAYLASLSDAPKAFPK